MSDIRGQFTPEEDTTKNRGRFSALEKEGIFTVEDFLLADKTALLGQYDIGSETIKIAKEAVRRFRLKNT